MSNKAQKRGLVPKLRFPEFRDVDEWKEIRLGSEGEFLSSLSGKAGDDFDAGEAKFVTYMNVFSNTFVDPKALRLVDVKEGENQNKVSSGDVFFTISSETPEEVGMSSVLLDEIENCYLNSFCALFRFSKSKRPNSVFTGYLLRQPLVRNYFAKKAQGSTRFNLSKEAFRNLPIFVPSPPEQQKIADCLASLDERITLEAQKLDTLKTHKKGLMQQLFPAEDETLPKLRFPEFRDAGGWKERELGPLTTKVGSGITPTGGDKNYKTKGRPFVRSQNVGWGELILNDVAFIDEKTHQSFDSTEIKVSDVLLNITGASIGRSAVADSRIVGGNVNQHVCIIRAQQVELNPALLNHFLISERGQKQIDSFQAGGNRQGLNFAQIRTFVIPLPPTEKEQRRIAYCLTSLDDLITAQTQKLAALKTHKKGLMQQLFPVLDEATA
jgi:type I restriction enzyme S subunit